MPILERLRAMEITEAVALLKGSYTDFCAAIEETLRSPPRQPIACIDDSPGEALICAKANELRSMGYTRLDSLIDPKLLDVASAFAKILPQRAAALGVDDKLIYDSQLQGTFFERHASRFNTRIGFPAHQPPAFLRALVDGVALCDKIIAKAIGTSDLALQKHFLFVDNLQPTETVDFQWWHFDRLLEQFKVMIFLDDVNGDNGPMRVLPGTHRFEGTRRIYDFCAYSEPLNGADPGYSVIRDRLADIVSAVGAVGDAFLFDTKVFHCHGRPTVAQRNTATIYYTPPATPLNLFYHRYQPAGQTVGY